MSPDSGSAADRRARLFLVDDHPVVRMGFHRLLEAFDQFTIVGEAGSGEEALEKISLVSPDLAIVDVAMRGMGGIELTHRLKQSDYAGQVLIVSMHDDMYYLQEALEAGADGYVLKENAAAYLVDAALRVLAGQFYLCNDVKEKLEG